MSKYTAWATATLTSVISNDLSEQQYAVDHVAGLGGTIHEALCRIAQVTQGVRELESDRGEATAIVNAEAISTVPPRYATSALWHRRLRAETGAEDDDTLLSRITSGSAVADSTNAAEARSELIAALSELCRQWVSLVNVRAQPLPEGVCKCVLTDRCNPPAQDLPPSSLHSTITFSSDATQTTTTAVQGFTIAQVFNDCTFFRGQLSCALRSLQLAVPSTGMRDFLPCEDSITVEQKYHPLIDFEGVLLRFSAITTTRSDGVDTIKIQGPQNDVLKCKAYLTAQVDRLIEQCVVAKVPCDHRLHSVAAGSNGYVFASFCSSFPGGSIECSPAGVEQDFITILGLPASVEGIRPLVEERVAALEVPDQNCTIQLEEDDPFKAHVLDHTEQLVSEVLTSTGATMQLVAGEGSDDDALKMAEIVLTGTVGQVQAAEAYLARVEAGTRPDAGDPSASLDTSPLPYPDGESAGAMQFPSDAELIVEVHAPEEYHRFLIGARGATMKQIQNESGALIFFPNTKNAPARVKPSSENVVTIVGAKDACERAQALIIARVKDCSSDSGTGKDSAYLRLLKSSGRNAGRNQQRPFSGELQVKVPSELHGFVVGGRGFVLKEIQTESGARVYLPTTKTAPARVRNAAKDVITIIGSQKACEIARDLVLARAEDAENGRRSKEDSAYMNLLQELRELGRTATNSKSTDSRKSGGNASLDHVQMHGGMHSQLQWAHDGMRTQNGMGLQEGSEQHFYITNPHAPGGSMHMHPMSIQVGEGSNQYVESVMPVSVEQQYMHHEMQMDTMHGHPHPSQVPLNTRHNPWTDPMQQPVVNGTHHHPVPLQHDQQVLENGHGGPVTTAAWSAQSDPPSQPNSAWPNPPGDKLGAAAAWSAAPGHSGQMHPGQQHVMDSFMQDPAMYQQQQNISEALFAQIMQDRQVAAEDVPGIVQMLSTMPLDGVHKCLEDPSFRQRMVQRCLQHVQQQAQQQMQMQPSLQEQAPTQPSVQLAQHLQQPLAVQSQQEQGSTLQQAPSTAAVTSPQRSSSQSPSATVASP